MRNRFGLGENLGSTGLDPKDYKGRIIDRRVFTRLAYGAFADVFDPQNAEDQTRLNKARENLLDFTLEINPTYIADKFHAHLANALTQAVKARTNLRLMIEAPPQHGKSTLVSHMLPSFWLAHHPDLPVLLTSYGANRAYDNSRRARAIAGSPMYSRLFGGNVPDPMNWRRDQWGFRGLPGYVLAAGIEGPMAGHGFGLALLDDPHESWEKAQSDTLRRKAFEWWQGTFTTRLWEGAIVVFITTRWHEEDLAGQVLASEGTVDEGGLWTFLRYPALAEEENEELGIGPDILGRSAGESLFPKRFSREHLERTRGIVGPQVWNSEYQQRPTRPEGFTFKTGRFEIMDVAPVTLCDMESGLPVNIKHGVRMWDLAATAKEKSKRDPDFTSGTLMARDTGTGKKEKGVTDKGTGKIWVLDQVAAQLDPEQVQALILQTARLDGPAVKVRMELEPGASGIHMIDTYRALLVGFDFDDLPHSGDKQAFADPWASQVNAGNVILLKGAWNKSYIAEHAAFPNGQHDDRVDSSAGALIVTVGLEKRFRKIAFVKA